MKAGIASAQSNQPEGEKTTNNPPSRHRGQVDPAVLRVFAHEGEPVEQDAPAA
jgi:hypothetical protein